MTIKGMLFRFLLIYFVGLFAAGLIAGLLGIKGSYSYIGIGILVGAILWVCSVFIKKNSRYFSDTEKVTVVVGMIVIDLLLQSLPRFFNYTQHPQVTITSVLLDIGLFGLLHAVVIYFSVNSAKKLFVKQEGIGNK